MQLPLLFGMVHIAHLLLYTLFLSDLFQFCEARKHLLDAILVEVHRNFLVSLPVLDFLDSSFPELDMADPVSGLIGKFRSLLQIAPFQSAEIDLAPGYIAGPGCP